MDCRRCCAPHPEGLAFCAVCGEPLVPHAGAVMQPAFRPTYATPAAQPGYASRACAPVIRTYMPLAIISVFFSVILGVFAILKAFHAKEKMRLFNDIDGAKRDAHSALTLSLAGIGVGVVLITLLVFLPDTGRALMSP